MTSAATAAAPKIRTHPAGSGLAWVQRGLRLFWRQPLLLVVLVGLGVLVLFTILVLLSVAIRPEAGNLAFMILTPAVSLGALTICRSIDQGQPAGSTLYFSALRDPTVRLRLLQLGVYSAIYIGLSTLLVNGMFGAPDGHGAGGNAATASAVVGDTPRPPASDQSPPPSPAPAADGAATVPLKPPGALPGSAPPPAADAPMSLAVFVAMLVVLLPYTMTMCFAPVLCAWHGLSTPKALFFSFFACWRNRVAMVVYVVTLIGISVIAVLILGSLITILNIQEGFGLFLLVAPLGFVTSAIAQAAQLEMIKDVIDAASPNDIRRDTAALPPA